jgi:hypothetical protein
VGRPPRFPAELLYGLIDSPVLRLVGMFTLRPMPVRKAKSPNPATL